MVCFCNLRSSLFFKTSNLFMFGSSVKKDAIVNIFTASNMFTICAVSSS